MCAIPPRLTVENRAERETSSRLAAPFACSERGGMPIHAHTAPSTNRPPTLEPGYAPAWDLSRSCPSAPRVTLSPGHAAGPTTDQERFVCFPLEFELILSRSTDPAT